MDDTPNIIVLSVTDLTRQIKDLLEIKFERVLVKGEISNFKAHSSGHWYFTLKDAGASISAVVWRSRTFRQQFMPVDGQEVVAEGRVTLYEKGGRYQVDIEKIYLAADKGDLYAQFEALKEKLRREGLFDESHKKNLPEFPQKIAVLTSDTGAALRDIRNVLFRRYPPAGLFLLPIPVQGEGAAPVIASAIDYINTLPDIDLILLARGGGSIEDLWPFNTEEVARAIFRSKIPVLTGIGHETDFTIADFVADYRAPTPSAAAELAVPHVDAVAEYLRKSKERLRELMKKHVESYENRTAFLLERLKRHSPENRLRQDAQLLDYLTERLEKAVRQLVTVRKECLLRYENLLQSLSPNAILRRGYALVRKESMLVSSVRELQKNDEVEIIFKDGQKEAVVKG